jgi:hypothetical protein
MEATLTADPFLHSPEMCMRTADGWGFFLLAKREVDPAPTLILQILDIACPPHSLLHIICLSLLSPLLSESPAHTPLN